MKTITKSSGNVFRDLGLPDADNLLIKARMVSRIAELIDRRGLSQDEAATLAGLDQPKISALLHGRFEGYTIDRLIRILNALGQDVRMSMNSKPKERARGDFTVA
jgi:predicted XRE-type DNA-binding protein